MSQSDLVTAIQQDDRARAADLLAADPALVNAQTGSGLSVLMLAQYYGRKEIVELLRAQDVQLNLHEAAAIGDVGRAAGWLAVQPELVNTFAGDGFTPLGLAAFFGHPAVVALLLDRGADPNLASQNQMRVAPLHSAVAGNHLPVVTQLLAAGADVNAVQADGFTPLMGAAQNGSLAVTGLLLAHGADPRARVHDDAQNFARMSPLDFATQAGAQDVVAALQRAGAA